MGANSHPASPHARRMALHDILEQSMCMQRPGTEVLHKAAPECLRECIQESQIRLKEAHQQQLELLEAFEMLLAMLNMVPETQLRSIGILCLLNPLIERLRVSVCVFNAELT